MAGSYSTTSSSHVKSITNEGPWPKICGCGDAIKYSTAKSDNNPGRRYKACPNYKDKQNKGCGYFRWIDKKVGKVGSAKHSDSKSLVEVKNLGRRVIILQTMVLVMMVVIALILSYGFGLFAKKKLYLALP